jgi:DNA primase
MISPNSIEQLKSQLDVVDVISNYVELKKNGANYKCICPFHSDTSPSCVVSPAKQIYKCFACGAGGDSVKFVMEYEKLSYPEAIEKLATDFNFTLEYTNDRSKPFDSKIMEDLHNWYKKLLDNHPTAKQYLIDRGVFESSIEKFGIAYAPSSQETLQFMSSIHANMNQAVELGVVGFDSGRYFARFIERIMFPIHSQSGKLVGFGGRTITGHQAKYVNSPQTKIFNKSKILYAYNHARDSIYKQKQMIVTEGYLDVVMLHQAGFTNAVATLGTALTSEHIPLLRKSDAKIVMAYDGDQAGLNAAMKAAKMLSAAGIDGGVIIFGQGMDPADMVKNDQVAQLKQMFSHPKPLPNFILEVITASYNLQDPKDKERAMHEAVAYLKTLSPLLQEEYKGMLAALLNISEGVIRLKPSDPKQPAAPADVHSSHDVWELTLLKTLIENPQVIDSVADYLEAGMFSRHAQAYELLLTSEFEHPMLLAISLDESIKTFASDDLRNEMLLFLKNYYTKMRRLIPRDQNLSYDDRVAQMARLSEKLQQINAGKLV